MDCWRGGGDWEVAVFRAGMPEVVLVPQLGPYPGFGAVQDAFRNVDRCIVGAPSIPLKETRNGWGTGV